MLRRTQTTAATFDEGTVSDLRAANERVLASVAGPLSRRPARSAFDTDTDSDSDSEFELASDAAFVRAAEAPKAPFVAAPALPLADDPSATFVVKPSEGRAARRGMDDLREQALRNVIANAAGPKAPGARAAAPVIRRGPRIAPSRIILISVALIAGGVAAYLASQLNAAAPVVAPVVTETIPAPMTKVLVAKDVIGIGERVTASAIEWIDWPDSALRTEFVTSTASPDALTEMEGAVARSEILPGEPILQQKLATPGGSYLAGVLESGMRGVSVPVTAASASGGFIAPNDRVDVVWTRTLEAIKVTETILRNVRVLAINGKLGPEEGEAAEATEEQSGASFAGETLATLELNTTQSELLINAMSVGELTLVLRSITDLSDSLTTEERAANQSIRASSPFWR